MTSQPWQSHDVMLKHLLQIMIFWLNFFLFHSRVPIVPPFYSEMLLANSISTNGLQKSSDNLHPSPMPESDDDFLYNGDEKAFDPSVDYYPQPYCSIVNSFSETCFSDTILELFTKNGNLGEETFDVLTPETIFEKLNGDMIRFAFFIFFMKTVASQLN